MGGGERGEATVAPSGLIIAGKTEANPTIGSSRVQRGVSSPGPVVGGCVVSK